VNSPTGGRAKLALLNRDILREIYGQKYAEYALVSSKISSLKDFWCALIYGHINGISASTIVKIHDCIEKSRIESVFIDGSNLGGLAKSIKEKFPEIAVVTFLHNVEASFFWGNFLYVRKVKALFIFIINKFAESRAIKFSDTLICLSHRDSHLLQKTYGRLATHITALAIKEPDNHSCCSGGVPNECFGIFVGGNFYGNYSGLLWYIKHVAPQSKAKIYVIGRGFESYADKINITGKVELIGEVEDLSAWYQAASFVIAPIFVGGGMKTKVAEAMMYGKYTIGTTEAFSGYENFVDVVGSICNKPEEFSSKINEFLCEQVVIDKNKIRSIFDAEFSEFAAKNRMLKILS
jgi:glycosyltransferase involved in cell wall biosynthesis